MIMSSSSTKKRKKSERQSLVDFVFSWSISDVMNKDYYSDKVKQIPETFTSTDHYLKSFINPLLEETRADLYSNLTTLSRAPVREVFDVKISKNFRPPYKHLDYTISLKATSEDKGKRGIYEPKPGDLIALTDVMPKRIDDLNRPKRPYVLALIQGPKDQASVKLAILSSKPIEFEKEATENSKTGDKLFAVYLTNMITNMRIWKALNPDPEATNMRIIRSVLQVNPNVGSTCSLCSFGKAKEASELNQIAAIQDFGLDKSQETAVLNCIATKDCYHQNTVKLIWGPQGTGKTKTVASLLFALSQMKCRTLTCAPTNVAVLGVVSRLMSLLRPNLKYDTYGLGDIVLFGNGKRMKIDDNEELFDVFLDYRVSSLSKCLAPLSGFRSSIAAMIRLLEDPQEQYKLYLERDDEAQLGGGLYVDRFGSGNQRKLNEGKNLGLKDKVIYWISAFFQTLKGNKEEETKDKASSQKLKHRRERSNGAEILLTFEKFFMKEFNSEVEQLIFCMKTLYTHLPTTFLPMEAAKEMSLQENEPLVTTESCH